MPSGLGQTNRSPKQKGKPAQHRHPPGPLLQAIRRTGLPQRPALPVDAFIACVTHGMAIGAINEKLGTKLLYAAQVATTSRKAQHQANRDQANRVPRSSSAWAGTNPTSSTNSANSAGSAREAPPSPSQGANSNPANKSHFNPSRKHPQPEYDFSY